MTDNRKRLLYVMENDWDWIKQRPHFLAEELASHFDVLILYKRQTRRSKLVRNASPTNRKPIFQIPFLRYRVMRQLNSIAFRAQLSIWKLLFNPQIFWYAHPFAQILAPKGSLVIYDCMDDHLTWDHTAQGNAQEEMLAKERKLLETANITLFSSETLRNAVTSRADCACDLVVPNAFGGAIVEDDHSDRALLSGNTFRLCYFGFISTHFDFTSIEYVLSQMPNLEVHLYGPKDVAIPNCDRIIYHGTLPHSELMGAASEYDAFILPFHLTPLTLSVDPVKIYEYINLNRRVISVRYKETEKFSEFCDLYSTPEELLSIIQRSSKNREPKFSNRQRIEFLKLNSWAARADQVRGLLDDIC